MEHSLETILALIIGIGLSAACGFRVFVPLLGMSIAAHTGHLTLSADFAWIASTPALVAFGTATALEIAAYYIPWLDNLMDTIATPLAIIAGIIVTASVITDISPFLRWTLAVIAGGGIATVIQSGSVAVRAISSGTTAGTANPIVSTFENIASVMMTVLSVIVPIVALIIVAGIIIAILTKIRKRKNKNSLEAQA